MKKSGSPAIANIIVYGIRNAPETKRNDCSRCLNDFAFPEVLTQDVNKSGKNFQMRKIRFFSLLGHKNLIQSIIL